MKRPVLGPRTFLMLGLASSLIAPSQVAHADDSKTETPITYQFQSSEPSETRDEVSSPSHLEIPFGDRNDFSAGTVRHVSAVQTESAVVVLVGGTTAEGQSSLGYGLRYDELISKVLNVSVEYSNDGHITGHHRDSFGIGIGPRLGSLNRGWELDARIGPNVFFDTKTSSNAKGYENSHGIGASASASLKLALSKSLFVEGQIKNNFAANSFSAHSFMIGIGYRRSPNEGVQLSESLQADSPSSTGDQKKHAVSVSTGSTTINSFSHEKSRSLQAEYRQELSKPIWISVSYLEASGRGITTQVFAVRQVGNRLELGVGIGSYFYADTGTNTYHMAVDTTLYARIKIKGNLGLKFSLNRIGTASNSDRESFKVGLDHKF